MAGACALGSIGAGAWTMNCRAQDTNTAPIKSSGKITVLEADRKYWKALDGGKVQCSLCPNSCVVSPGGVSYCRTRKNRNGALYTHAYNNPVILTVDPYEKYPLYHFMPGTKALVLAPGGCNLRCQYCQNWEQSQSEPDKLKTFYALKEDVVKAASSKGCTAVGYTYTDPVAFFEYARDVAAEARSKGLKTVFGTAAYINPAALKELCEHATAFSVTLKGFSEKFYSKVTGVKLQPVLDALVAIRKSGKWLEVVNLVIPTLNDEMKDLEALGKWVKANLGEDVPLHFERFVPAFRMKDLPMTPVNTLEEARGAALAAGLKYVYMSNLSPHDGNHTYCPKCKELLIKRLGFTTLEVRVNKGTCSKCGSTIPGVWS